MDPCGNNKEKKTIRLLLVDDEKGFLDVLSNRLSRRLIHPVKAYSGTQAIQILRKQDFDVVVLDLKMEDMDGIEVLKVIKRMVPDLPVILLTGHGSQTAAKEGILSGAFDFLTKPCELVELMEKIKEAHEHQQKQSNNLNLLDLDKD
ncbi:MAG: two-component system response regulator [Desulfobacula sp. RIFOXYA12_FULL_46_16]|nr:MAG: two-component system response regulator [Deltaproteobacteria bacterium RIFOXYC2_FULL_48_10]OGR20753.1 MAG: two-component system response regulator [Desulfobacula sp. RIFOXYA12_FULL_46_16]OGR41613.1 MAG: two-component system response regulator [Desulfobacula sp. RIFOXYB2_FULL_45_6]